MTPRPYRQRDGGYVYAIRHEHDYVKLGESTSPVDRLDSLQTACPYELYLYTTVAVVGEREAAESRIHEVYDAHRINGEWFELPDAELSAMADINKVHTPVIEKIEDWSFTKHADLSEETLDGYRATEHENKIDKQVQEFVKLVEAGKFPVRNIKKGNAAIESRAKKAEVSPARFIERAREQLDNDTDDS